MLFRQMQPVMHHSAQHPSQHHKAPYRHIDILAVSIPRFKVRQRYNVRCARGHKAEYEIQGYIQKALFRPEVAHTLLHILHIAAEGVL